MRHSIHSGDLGMDLELLEWLNTRTFPEEAKYKDNEYAKKAYSIFADNMKRSATTRACIFATLHRDATEILMDLMEEAPIKTMVGKVNMDRNSPDFLVKKGRRRQRKKRSDGWRTLRAGIRTQCLSSHPALFPPVQMNSWNA